MNENPKISVVIPVYNSEKYLRKCIESVLAQTLEEFELIFINDGSVDGSETIIKEYCALDERIRYKTVSNGGPAKARNLGVEMAHGKYISFVDADDTIKSNMLRILYDEAQRHDLDVVVCNYTLMKSTGMIMRESKHPIFSGIYEGDEIKNEILKQFYKDNYITLPSLWNKLYRTDFLKKYDLLIPEHLTRAEDYWFNFEVLLHASRVKLIEDNLYNYMQVNDSSIMHCYKEEQFEIWNANRKKLLKYNQELNFDIDYNLFYKNYLYNVATYIVQTLGINSLDKKQRIIDILKNTFYADAVKYSKYLPIHIRGINWLIQKKRYRMAYLSYKLWYKIRG